MAKTLLIGPTSTLTRWRGAFYPVLRETQTDDLQSLVKQHLAAARRRPLHPLLAVSFWVLPSRGETISAHALGPALPAMRGLDSRRSLCAGRAWCNSYTAESDTAHAGRHGTLRHRLRAQLFGLLKHRRVSIAFKRKLLSPRLAVN